MVQNNFAIDLFSTFLSDLANIKCTRYRQKFVGWCELSEYWRSEVRAFVSGINEFTSLLTTFLPDLGAGLCKECAHSATDTMWVWNYT